MPEVMQYGWLHNSAMSCLEEVKMDLVHQDSFVLLDPT